MPSIINATTSTGLVTTADNSGSLQLATNSGTTALTIDTSQNVGIGRAPGAARLDLEAASGQTKIILRNVGNTSDSSTFIAAETGSVGDWANLTLAARHALRFVNNSVENMRISSAGQVTIPNQPAFSAFGLGGTFSSSSWAKLSYTTAITNAGSNYNAGNARFTAPVAGSYYFYFNALHRNTTNGARMALYKNGAKFYDAGNTSFSQTYNQVNAEAMAGAGVIISLAANDYVEVYAIVAGAGDLYLAGNGHNVFMGNLIG